MSIKVIDIDTIQCDKWIAVGDIVLDFTLKDYDMYYFMIFTLLTAAVTMMVFSACSDPGEIH